MRIVRIPIAIDIRKHLDSAILETERDTARNVVLYNRDMIEQALAFPGNLAATRAGNATGIISGMLVDVSSSEPQEDWDKLICTYRVIGTAIVQVNQAVA
jgi:hypothetical protein